MPVYLKDGMSVFFIHVPKAGGSSVEQLFKQDGWRESLRESRRSHPQLMSLRRCSPQHFHGALLREMFNFSRFDVVFLISREPLSRFRSEYAMRHARDPRPDEESVQEWADRAFDRFQRNPYMLDNHLRPQHEFLIEQAHVYKLEDGLANIVTDLNARFGLGLSSHVPHELNRVDRSGIASADVRLPKPVVARLVDFYEEDFRQFGYARPTL